MNDKQIERYLNGTASKVERAEVEAWFEAKGEALPYAGDPKAMEAAQERTLALLQDRIAAQPKIKPLHQKVYRYAAAASILLAIGASTYFALKPKVVQQQTAQLIKNDIAPGHNQATLTLANGKKIILTKGLNGVLATQGKTTIQASSNDIAYNNSQKADQLVYNTLSTAKGEQSPYPLVLADGTKVWLNAESSITFPTAFSGKERVVKITGEAYIKVAHNAAQPFRVQTTNQTIEDIGTEFDVKSYSDEPAAATLVEGSIKVNGALLKPGEEILGDRIETANLKTVLAWKDGYFRFKDASISTIMRELARWYNIEVVYEGQVTTEHFSAKISRYKNISSVLNMLEKTKHVRFKVEGRRITVLSKS